MGNEKVVLQSSKPLEKVSSGIVFYGVSFGVGFVLSLVLLLGGGAEVSFATFGVALLFAFICALVGWGLRNKVMKYKSMSLRRRRFLANEKPVGTDLYQRLLPVLQPMGMELTVTEDGTFRVTYMNLYYDIIFHEDDSFSIWWSQSLGRALLSSNYYISIYKRAVVAMGLIGFHVQRACTRYWDSTNEPGTDIMEACALKVNSARVSDMQTNENGNVERKNEGEEFVENRADEVTKRFCTKCQKTFPAGAKFCSQCGEETAELINMTEDGKDTAPKGLSWKDCTVFKKAIILFSPLASLVEVFIAICVVLVFKREDSLWCKIVAVASFIAIFCNIGLFFRRLVGLLQIGKKGIKESVFYNTEGSMLIKLFCYPIAIVIIPLLIKVEPFDRVADFIFRHPVFYTQEITFDEYEHNIGTMASKLRGEEWRVKKIDKDEYKVYLTGYLRDISEEIEIEFRYKDLEEDEYWVSVKEITLKDSDESYSDAFSIRLILEMLDEQ